MKYNCSYPSRKEYTLKWIQDWEHNCRKMIERFIPKPSNLEPKVTPFSSMLFFLIFHILLDANRSDLSISMH